MDKLITIYLQPDERDIDTVIRRPQIERKELENSVRSIMHAVRDRGDSALVEFSATYDRAQLTDLFVSKEERYAAGSQVRPDLRMAMKRAAANIKRFHEAQQPNEEKVTVEDGVRCWRRVRPIERVGIYIPGGTAPLFSTVLMLAIPARLAGCKEIVLCTPPREDGTIHPAILYAADISGITTIVKAGGAQAIAAMTFGTESIAKVDKIFGPGNQYVTKAKELAAAYGTAIDMPAGPSEVMIAADSSADPEVIAADMLSQAEHGMDSHIVTMVDVVELLDAVLTALYAQLKELPRREFAESSLSGSSILCLSDKDRVADVINRYAPEHLIIMRRDAYDFEELITNAGSVFIGPWTPESAGDYASGTNHTLPTNGWARAYSGVSLDSFIKKVTFQEISPQGLQKLGPVIEILAEAESLTAHKQAVSIRLEKLNGK